MFDRELVPPGLAEMPPGPVSAAWLSSLDRSQLNGHDLVIVMKALARLAAHVQAELMATMVEVAQCPPGGPESSIERVVDQETQEFAADEIRAALRLTRRAADTDLGLAWDVKERLPRVWEALHCGDIDVRRARTITTSVSHLPVETAQRVVDEVIDHAPVLTTGQLATRIRRLCVKVDPDDARGRYAEGLAGRRVVAEANPDGTADLYGAQLPPDRVTGIRRRINRLARSLKSADDPRTLDQIRADVFLDLLDGTVSGTKTADRATVDIQVDLATLAGMSDDPGEILGWGPVISDIARRVVSDQPAAQWRVNLTDPDSNNLVWSGITNRRPNLDQQRLVQTRQPTCVFPGCRMPSSQCDLDHTRAWVAGGPTVVDNLAPLCRHDHRLKHEAGWHLQTTGPGE